MIVKNDRPILNKGTLDTKSTCRQVSQYDSMIISFCARIEYFPSMTQKRGLDWTLNAIATDNLRYLYLVEIWSLLDVTFYVLEYPNYPGPQAQFFSIQVSQLVNHMTITSHHMTGTFICTCTRTSRRKKKHCIAQWYIIRSTLISYPSWVAVAVPDTPFGSSPNKACMSSVPCGSWICCWLCTWSSA